MLPVFWAEGSFSCECSGGKSHCRTIDCHPSSAPTPLHAPGTLAGPDSTRLQHFPQVVLNFFNQQQGNPSKLLFKGSVICNFYCLVHGVGTAQFHWIQWEHAMVFSQEPVDSICQLGGPGLPATQVQFIEQFTMSLLNGQSGGMGILGLISPLQQLDFFKGFVHRQCCYCSGHLGFLPEGLWVCGVVPYHHNFFFTALPQLGYIFCTVRPCGKEPASVCKACTIMLICYAI